MICPAIIVVGYNRVSCIERLLNSINQAYYPSADISLIVALDRSDKTDDIISAAKKIGFNSGTMEFRVQNERIGLKKHILECGDLSEKYGAVIILEDDLIVSKTFYSYALQAVNYYRECSDVAGIALYSHMWNGYSNYEFLPSRNQYDAYLGQFSVTWGQCWTSGQWKNFKSWLSDHIELRYPNYNIPEEIEYWGDNSWGKYYANYVADNKKYYVMPYDAQSTNCSDPGEHNERINSICQVVLEDSNCPHEYRFPNIDQAVKYDIFFDRILDGIDVAGIKGQEICNNLNCIKRNALQKKYLLTTSADSNLKLVKSYALMLRPIENNVLFDIDGKDIFLYELPYLNYSINNKVDEVKRISYEMYGHGFQRMISIGKQLKFEYYKNKISNYIKRRIYKLLKIEKRL